MMAAWRPLGQIVKIGMSSSANAHELTIEPALIETIREVIGSAESANSRRACAARLIAARPAPSWQSAPSPPRPQSHSRRYSGRTDWTWTWQCGAVISSAGSHFIRGQRHAETWEIRMAWRSCPRNLLTPDHPL